MEFTTTQIVLLTLFVLGIAALYTWQTNVRKDANKCFKFEVEKVRGRIVMRATNEVDPKLGFEAHFYARPNDLLEPNLEAVSNMQQYFGRRTYTFITNQTDNFGVNTAQIGQEIIKLSLADRRTFNDDRVDFDLQLIQDMLFGMYYESIQGAAISYSQEMFNSMISAGRNFIRINRELPNVPHKTGKAPMLLLTDKRETLEAVA